MTLGVRSLPSLDCAQNRFREHPKGANFETSDLVLSGFGVLVDHL